MNCKYCNDVMNYYLNGYSCSKYANHSYQYFSKKNNALYVNIFGLEMFIGKQNNLCRVTYNNFDDVMISEIRYEEIFDIKTKEQLDQWLLKVKKEIVFK